MDEHVTQFLTTLRAGVVLGECKLEAANGHTELPCDRILLKKKAEMVESNAETLP
jgi:hypothetical protein